MQATNANVFLTGLGLSGGIGDIGRSVHLDGSFAAVLSLAALAPPEMTAVAKMTTTMTVFLVGVAPRVCGWQNQEGDDQDGFDVVLHAE